MTYELAKKLKDAGFPQKSAPSYEDVSEKEGWHVYLDTQNTAGRHATMDFDKPRPSARFKREYLDSSEGIERTVYFPTLSELIVACGTGFGTLKRNDEDGMFSVVHSGDYEAYEWINRKDPEDAVAELWLTLHEGTPSN